MSLYDQFPKIKKKNTLFCESSSATTKNKNKSKLKINNFLEVFELINIA